MEPGFLVFVLVTIAAMTAYAAFQQWIRHQRRLMIHRERLAALEKSIALPPLEQEVQHRGWNVQRLLLFAGLIWISLGVGSFLILTTLIGESFQFLWGRDRFGNPVWITVPIRHGMQWIGATLFGIGLSHVIVYAIGRNRED